MVLWSFARPVGKAIDRHGVHFLTAYVADV